MSEHQRGVMYRPEDFEPDSDFFNACIITSGLTLIAVYSNLYFPTPQAVVEDFALANNQGVPCRIVDYAVWLPSEDNQLLATIQFEFGDDGNATKSVTFLEDTIGGPWGL